MKDSYDALCKVFQYELSSAERYCRFVTLVMIAPASEADTETMTGIVSQTLRSSDMLATKNGSAVVLMGETDRTGAMAAIGRYKDRCGTAHDLRFSVVTYPTDDAEPTRLFDTASRRLERATTMSDFGAVVAEG